MSHTRNEFEELMDRLRRGDPEAPRELFERYGKAVQRVVRFRLNRRLRTQYDSLDFTQDAWASFFHIPAENLAFRTPEELVAFLTRIVKHKMIDAYRKHRRHLDASPPKFPRVLQFIDAQPARLPTPSQFAIAEEEWSRMIYNKPPKIQLALTMLRDGYSQREIALKLGLNVRRIHRLLAKLKQLQTP